MEKKELRRELLAWRGEITSRDRCLWDCDLSMRLLRLPQYAAADTLLCYLSAPQEVSTALLVAHAIGIGKRVGVPRWSGGRMDFRLFTNYDRLVADRAGLRQPLPDAEVLRDLGGALCVVPALAVDREGYRLGYGGGYYDRFLAEFSGFSAAVCYSPALWERLEREPHDRPVDCVVTPNESIFLRGEAL